MINPNLILKKIVFIRDHIERVRAPKDCTLEEFLGDRNRENRGEIYRQMIAFRNLITHQYAETDFREVYEVMTKQLGGLDDFIEAIITYCHL